MQKILAFCFFPAFMPPQSGGVSRLFNVYQALSQHFDVTLITSTHASGPDERIDHGANFVEIRVAKDAFFHKEWKRLASYAGSGDMSAPTLAACGQWPTRMHEVYLQEYANADIIVHDFPFMVDYDIYAGLDNKPRIYNAHNCETTLYKNLHPEAKSAPIHELVQRCEQKLLNLVDTVWYCGEEDLTAFRQLAPEAGFEAIFVPNGTTPLPPVAQDKNTETLRAVFMGSGHLPNVEAAEFIVQHVAPALPNWQFDFIGSCLDQSQSKDNVTAHGIVNSNTKKQLLQQATLALNPMRSGSGSNVKVLDYFAHGLPVLSTPMGMRGIDAVQDEQVWLVDLDQFVAQLQQIATQPEQCAAMAKAASVLAQQRYSWQALVLPAVEALQQRLLQPQRQPNYVLALNDYDSYFHIGGGCVRTQGIYQAVSTAYPVVFICFSAQDALRTRVISDQITLIEVPKTAAHQNQEHQDNSRCSPISVNDIIAAQQACNNPWLWAIYSQLSPDAYAIVLEHVYMAPLPLKKGQRFIYSSHNHEGDLKTRLLPERGADLAKYVVDLEKEVVAKAIATIAVSESDAHIHSQSRSAGPIFVIPNGSLPPESAPSEDIAQVAASMQSASAVFLGSAHPPNIEAAQFIVNTLAPACPQIQFHLIGSVCDSVRALPTNVKAWGVVDEGLKTAIMQRATVALNPVISGSGSNIKLADFMGNGLFTLTTPFGARGYPEVVVNEHCQVAELADFAETLKPLYEKGVNSEALRQQRQQIFVEELSMAAQAQHLVRFLDTLATPRQRLLFVTYRYTDPSLGGAEQMMEHLLRAADASGDYLIDVIAPELTRLENDHLYREKYIYDADTAAFVDLERTRFTRFPIDGNEAVFWENDLRRIWRTRVEFERQLYAALPEQQGDQAALAWGWSYPEQGISGKTYRWAFVDCGIYVPSGAQLHLDGEVLTDQVLTVTNALGQLCGEYVLKGKFNLALTDLPAGAVRLFSSTPTRHSPDPRPLAFKVTQCVVNGTALDFSAPTLCHVNGLPANQGFAAMDQAAKARSKVRLTDVRGPWSSGLEQYLARYTDQYDAIITHNSVFRPAVAAIEAAKKAKVPSFLVPHAHLDDDYYHFADVLQAAQDASLVFGAPKAACQFFEEKGCNVSYLPAGIDANEAFTQSDVDEFDAVYSNQDKTPFVLVLGRKSGAKGYQHVIDAVNGLNGKVRVVLIGPDDDGVAVNSVHATYLGRQPRSVVRGALQRCLALVTMSRSESFGIVLLESWMARKPVIANTHCAAFHDMAVQDQNALLVDETTVAAAIEQLLADPDLAERLGEQGHAMTAQYDWSAVGQQFLDAVAGVLKS